MRIGILGTGTLATALAVGWRRAGHDITVAGRSRNRARALADRVSGIVRPVTDVAEPTNAVEHGVGVLRVGPGRSFAGHVADLAPGAQVVKAFHLFPASTWTAPNDATVAMCGDDAHALDVVGRLVRDVGGTPAVLGGLDRVRQLEEVAGFVIGLAFAGMVPRSAVP